MKGKKYTINYCAIFTIKNGKIVKETDYFDQVAFLRQVGFFDQK
jgi:ketosteroid isomerase-like protein